VNHAILFIEMGGPTFILIMVQNIMSLNERSFSDRIEHMHRMRITYFTGNDLDKVVSNLCCQSLIVVDKLPSDCTTTCLELFQTSNLPVFNKVFDTIQFSIRIVII